MTDNNQEQPSIIQNINEVHDATKRFGAKVSDIVAAFVGSWKFVILMTVFFAGWILFNVTALFHHFDPAPFIMLNLCLSFLASYTAPFIMMSQNRQEEKDRVVADHDYKINLKAERELREVSTHLSEVLTHLASVEEKLLKQEEELSRQDDELLSQTKILNDLFTRATRSHHKKKEIPDAIQQ